MNSFTLIVTGVLFASSAFAQTARTDSLQLWKDSRSKLGLVIDSLKGRVVVAQNEYMVPKLRLEDDRKELNGMIKRKPYSKKDKAVINSLNKEILSLDQLIGPNEARFGAVLTQLDSVLAIQGALDDKIKAAQRH